MDPAIDPLRPSFARNDPWRQASVELAKDFRTRSGNKSSEGVRIQSNRQEMDRAVRENGVGALGMERIHAPGVIAIDGAGTARRCAVGAPRLIWTIPKVLLQHY